MLRCTLCFTIAVAVVHKLPVLSLALGMLGQVDLVFKTVEDCEEPRHVMELTIDQHKFNRSVVVMDVTVDTPFDIDGDVTLELLGSLKKEGGYKPGSFYLKDQACKCLQTILGDMFIDILKATGKDGCPLPAGKHFAPNFFFDNRKFTVPAIYGDYKMEALVWRNGELQSCFNVYYEFVPKSN